MPPGIVRGGAGRGLLIVLGGLPGAGKSTVAAALAQRIGALHLRIDTIEQAMRNFGVEVRGPEGYLVACDVAEDNLRLGRTVIADSVNPLAVTRELWRSAGTRAGAALAEIELVCSDAAEHRRRVESRTVTISGLVLPTWQQVLEREYHAWATATIVDTADREVDEIVEQVARQLPR